ncbi:MAG: hypothetical protein P4L41_10660 [Flavipsychrobacter sp.]|nr:hypothetical protein [Flavipsychrobacter sp.]
MDKNLINIDDLFRQRLSGGEEEEREGAWMNMRNLLDEEMPVKPAGGIRWRRMLTYTAGLLLLALAALGGYEAITAHRATGTGEAAVAATSKGMSQNSNGTNNNIVPVNATGNNTSKAIAANTTTTHNVTGNIHQAKPALSASAKSITDPAATITSTTNQDAVIVPAKTKSGKTFGHTNTHVAVTSNKNDNVTTINHKIAHASSIASIKRNSIATTQKTGNTSTNATGNAVARKTASAAGNKLTGKTLKSVTQKKAITSGNTSTIVAKQTKNSHSSSVASVAKAEHKKAKTGSKVSKTSILPAAGISTVASGNKLQSINNDGIVAKQSVDKVEVVQHNVTKPGDRKGHYVNDTVDKGVVSVNKYVPSADQQTPADRHTGSATTTAPVVSASASAAGNTTAQKNGISATTANKTTAQNSAGNTVLLASAAKGSTATVNNSDIVATHTRRKSSTLSNFAEMILDFRTNLGNAKFAPGITGGINSAFFAPNAINGFHLGVSGTFIISDTWSLMGELKYFNRFSGNSVINDNYVKYTALSNGGYAKDSVQQYFKYNSLQSIELPVSIQYTIGKVGMYVGGNLVYNFSIYNDFETNPNPTEITSQPGKSITPKYRSGDFSSRFGVGYLFGASYSITPMLRADARLVQTVWDNSSTMGGQMLSNNLYKNPSFQLSIGYTFKHQESRMP